MARQRVGGALPPVVMRADDANQAARSQQRHHRPRETRLIARHRRNGVAQYQTRGMKRSEPHRATSPVILSTSRRNRPTALCVAAEPLASLGCVFVGRSVWRPLKVNGVGVSHRRLSSATRPAMPWRRPGARNSGRQMAALTIARCRPARRLMAGASDASASV